MKSILLLLAIQISFTLHEVQGNRKTIGCKAGTFTERQSVNVTCLFNVDIKQHRKNFNIVQYPSIKGSSSSDSGNYVLVCNWGAGTSLECKTEDGYLFDKTQVSDEVTLGIPNVSLSKAGVYVCQTVPDGGIPLETCNLSVKEFAEANYPVTTTPASGVCPNATCQDSPMMVAVLAIVVVILVCVVLIGGIFYVRLHYSFKRLTSKSAKNPQGPNCCGFTRRQAKNEGSARYKAVANDDATVKLETTPGANTAEDARETTGNSSVQGVKNQYLDTQGQKGETPQPGGKGLQPVGQQGAAGTGEIYDVEAGKLEAATSEEEKCDFWTPQQVGEWLRKEGFEKHVKLFEQVNGTRLLTFNYTSGLWSFGVGGGSDGNDRVRLLEKINVLRKAVAARKKRENSKKK